MSEFDFDQIIGRRDTDSCKWDAPKAADKLPMWVADMDFKTAPCVIEALQARVEHGIFGYAQVPSSYYDAVTNWFATQHQFTFKPEWMLYTSGVVPAISAILKALIEPGDKVIVQTPVYNCFFSSIRNMQAQLVENPLICQQGYYQMDFADLQQKAADPKVKALLLCNPHNPVGRAWTKEELTRLGDICLAHDVTVICDEIHCDLVFPGVIHQPFAAINERFAQCSVTTVAASKTFNLAGLQLANILVKEPELRQKIDKALNVHEVCDVGPLGITAATAAYTHGQEWLAALRQYLFQNYQHVVHFFTQHCPQITVTKQQATYLVWLDITETGFSSDELSQMLAEQGKLLLNSGTVYGSKTGEGYIRVNIACPRSILEDGLRRIVKVIANNRV
ncbi:MalY/PatB family protein [Alteromonas lipolytica]|uniref:cysteine-S-conjugate beta-lyase n=1 Tax=Alteromonas lipolytica TaxID=1856405 RepID=A0A1E8FGW2_9ALTE|nr:MalY/PatB family protein [Alteromonas lipolytica]OFI35182.1 cystathionine beta-lyase [Alteromonas lipolytica]GGF57405.1 aminotransferase [Alteromonas lipolytica]